MDDAALAALLAKADSALASVATASVAASAPPPAAAPVAAPAPPPAAAVPELVTQQKPVMQKLLILYGTQTGNSRGVAKELGAEAAAHGFEARVLGMEKWKELDFEQDKTPLVLVSSSTGNGDAPDNADKFYRFAKKRSTPPVFKGVPFAVCALGDSNYEQFSEVGRQFDQHLERLGGNRFLKRCDVDEVDGIEAHVHPWAEKLWPALKALKQVAPAQANRGAEQAAEAAPAKAAAKGAAPAAAPGVAPLRSLTVFHSGGLTEEIAELIKAEAAAASPAASVRLLAMAKFKPWLAELDAAAASAPQHAVFLCQTVENEQPPEEAGPCVRFLQRRTHAAGMLAGKLHFAVLGLGDSNLLLDRQTTAAKDCNQVAQAVDRRLSELGADRFHPRGEADDRTGNQEVQPWLAALRASLAAAAAAAANGGNGGRSTTANGTNGTNGANNGANNSNGSNGARSAEPDPDAGAGPEKPLLARIVAARWLTASTESPTAGGRAGWQSGAAATAAAAVRRVLHLELDVSALPAGCALEPGDALAVVPQNDPTDVKELLPQLGVRAKQADTPLQLPDGFDAPMHLGGELTPRTALLERVDIGSTSSWPSPALLRLLLKHGEPANADAPRLALVRRATAQAAGGDAAAARAAHASLVRERPPLLQLLRQLASRPPLVDLLDALPPLAPRWYSLASSPLASPGRAHLCVSIAAYTATDAAGTRHLRRGVASHFLERTAAPLLKAGGAEEAAAAVPVFWREPSGHELRLPPSPATPVVVIGPGTGLAPFRAFLQHRRFAHARKRLGPCVVYFGCRSRADDFLYGEELEPMHAAGAITLRTAFSREAPPATAGYWRGLRLNVDYVQDLLEEDGQRVAQLLLEQAGHLYVCGDGQSMASDVHAALRRIVEAHLSVSPAEAEERLQGLAQEGRYCREIWN